MSITEDDIPTNPHPETLPAPFDESEQETGKHHSIPGFVGQPAPLDMSEFPAEIRWLAGRFKDFAEALNTVAEVAQDAVAHNKAAAEYNKRMAEQTTVLAGQARAIQVAVETTLVDHAKRILALESGHFEARIELLAEAQWGSMRPAGWHPESAPPDSLYPGAE